MHASRFQLPFPLVSYSCSPIRHRRDRRWNKSHRPCCSSRSSRSMRSEKHAEWLLDKAIMETFPASDPVAPYQPELLFVGTPRAVADCRTKTESAKRASALHSGTVNHGNVRIRTPPIRLQNFGSRVAALQVIESWRARQDRTHDPLVPRRESRTAPAFQSRPCIARHSNCVAKHRNTETREAIKSYVSATSRIAISGS